METDYKNIYINLNSKLYEVSQDKYNKKIRELRESISTSDGYIKELLTYKYEVLQDQYEELLRVNGLTGQEFKKHRRVIVGNLLDDRFYELISQDVIEQRHPNMYRIDLTSNLPLVLAYTFNLDYIDTCSKIDILCNSIGISREYLSYCILSQARPEILKCEVELGTLWTLFPEIKKFLGELCKISNETERCLVDCVTNTMYNQYLCIPVDDEETQLLTALSLRLVITGQTIINNCIVQIDSLKKTDGSFPRIYSQYICGCLFGAHGYIPEILTVTNSDGTSYYIEIEKY